MYKIVRFFLFLFNPELIHHISFKLIKFGAIIPGKMWAWRLLFKVRDTRLEREVFGLKFENPVGLAAGFDKDAKLFDELASFGFGFVEIGTVTPLPQDGNPHPRLFRLKEDSALINRMGFNNLGSEQMSLNLKRHFEKYGRPSVPLWINLGKSKVTSLEDSHLDYSATFEKLWVYGDVFVINVSSPNICITT